MSENIPEDNFDRHFGFLEKDYGFTITRENKSMCTQYIATTDYCRIMAAISKNPEGYPIVNIQPAGKALQDMRSQKYSIERMNISRLALYYDPDIKEPFWWETDVPFLPIYKQAAIMEKYCQKMLRGDFSEWPSIMDWMEKRFKDRSAKFNEEYEKCGYEFVKQDGKYGLTCNRIPVLPPAYSTIELFNLDSHEYNQEDYQDEPEVNSVGEYNFTIVMADGKYGLLSGREFRLPLSFLKIMKLSFRHYLCQTDTDKYALYDSADFQKPLAELNCSGELTLKKLWQTLENENPAAFSHLGESIQQVNNEYISQYRRYGGCENIESYFHYFTIATICVVLHNDFSISEPVKILKP